MPGHSLHAVEKLNDWSARVENISNSVTRLQTLRDQLVSDREAKEREVVKLAERQDILIKVGELYRVLMDRLVMGQIQTIEKIVTDGLRAIFYDQDLRFIAEVGESRGKVSVDFFICQGDPERGGIKGSPLDSFGGGPSSIASLILRILTLLRSKRHPLLLLDETLAAVAVQYIENTSLFLQRLAVSSNLDVLLVTHQEAFLSYADNAFQGESKRIPGPVVRQEFKVKRLRGAK